MEAALEITPGQTCGSSLVFSAALWDPQALQELSSFQLLCGICSKESSDHEGKESPGVGVEPGLCTAPPEGWAGSWAEEIPEKLLVTEPELCWESVFTDRLQRRILQSHNSGGVCERAETTRAGGEESEQGQHSKPWKQGRKNPQALLPALIFYREPPHALEISSLSFRENPLSFKEVSLIFL